MRHRTCDRRVRRIESESRRKVFQGQFTWNRSTEAERLEHDEHALQVRRQAFRVVEQGSSHFGGQRVGRRSHARTDPRSEVAAYPIDEQRPHPDQRLARDTDCLDLLADHSWDVHRGEIDATGGLAQCPGIALVILEPALPDPQCTDQRRCDHNLFQVRDTVATDSLL